jgi:hypothetical protein
VERISGPEKFGSSAKKDFFNTIDPKRTRGLFPNFPPLHGTRDLLAAAFRNSKLQIIHFP